MRFARRAPILSAALATLAMASINGAMLRAQTTPSKPKPAARPDYKNLRFDEVWTAANRTSHWDDAIKAMPLVPQWPLTLTLGGQLRWREEMYRHFNLTSQDDDNDQSRLLLSGDLNAGNRNALHARVFGEFRDAQSYGRNLPGGARSQDADRHDTQNLFADVAYGASFVRYGRQEIALGRERLVGVPDWSNTRRGSQGTRAMLVHDALALDVTDARPMIMRQQAPNRPDSTQRLRTISLGSAPNAKALARGLPATWQGYWYEQTIHTATTNTRRLTTGARAVWQWGRVPTKRSYSIEFEGGQQGGHVNAREIHAWFAVADAQATVKQWRGAPTLALGVEEASGENPYSSALEAFTVLYPAAHSHGGYADLIGRANARELHAISTWDPWNALSLRGAWYRFDRLRLDDGAYTKQNTVLRSANLFGTPASGASYASARHIANEMDLTATLKLSRHLRIIGGYSTVTPGDFLTTTGTALRERWGFAGTTFTF